MPLFIPTLSLLPSGHVVFLPDGGEAALPDIIAARIETAFHGGTAAGLLHPATAELTTPLPPTFAFWRDFSRRCLTQLCRIAGTEAEQPDMAAFSILPPLSILRRLKTDRRAFADLPDKTAVLVFRPPQHPRAIET